MIVISAKNQHACESRYPIIYASPKWRNCATALWHSLRSRRIAPGSEDIWPNQRNKKRSNRRGGDATAPCSRCTH